MQAPQNAVKDPEVRKAAGLAGYDTVSIATGSATFGGLAAFLLDLAGDAGDAVKIVTIVCLTLVFLVSVYLGRRNE